MAAAAILDLMMVTFDPKSNVYALVSTYSSNFVSISLDLTEIYEFLLILRVWLGNHRPCHLFGGFWGLPVTQIFFHETQKRHFLGWKRIV
jgi:hypothetical protein